MGRGNIWAFWHPSYGDLGGNVPLQKVKAWSQEKEWSAWVRNWKSDSGEGEIEMHVERFANICGAGGVRDEVEFSCYLIAKTNLFCFSSFALFSFSVCFTGMDMA